MNNVNKFQNALIVLLITAVVGMAIGFAALSQNLKITGTTTFKASKWSVILDKDTYETSTGSVTPATEPTITTTTMTYSVTLKPGEKYEFDIDAVNEGTIDALLKTITFSGDPLDGDYYDTTFTYAGTEYTGNQTGLSIELVSEASATIHVKVQYAEQTDDNASIFPEEDTPKTFTVTLGYESKPAS